MKPNKANNQENSWDSAIISRIEQKVECSDSSKNCKYGSVISINQSEIDPLNQSGVKRPKKVEISLDKKNTIWHIILGGKSKESKVADRIL